ncbi:MAG: NTP transferase domain-containing protein [Rubellimicrobium sp.]|nr:NTP transferase domain-containing protein [Rubellimicrobium sp.]
MSGAIAVAVLGAGLATRFGSDKLAAPLHGRPLAHHVLAALAGFDWPQKLLVCRGAPDWSRAYAQAGFTLLQLPDASAGLRGSMHRAAQAATCERLLICLADMPQVPRAHLQALLDAARDWPGAVASVAPGYRGPPAILPVAALRGLPATGDEGARPLLQQARQVAGESAWFADIDRTGDLERLAAPMAPRQAGQR